MERYKRCLLRYEQSGHGEPWQTGVIFQGRRAQRGFGFGSFLASAARLALPFVKKIGKQVLTQAIEGGKDVILGGKKPREVLKSRGKQILGNLLQGQTGSGLKRKRGKTEIWTSRKRTRRL